MSIPALTERAITHKQISHALHVVTVDDRGKTCPSEQVIE